MQIASKSQTPEAAPVMYELAWPVQGPAVFSSSNQPAPILWEVSRAAHTLRARAQQATAALLAQGTQMLQHAAEGQASGSVSLQMNISPADQV